jgi:hypothetical protein
MRIILFTIITISAGALPASAQSLEVIPLSKTTIQSTIEIDGKIQKSETKDIVGLFGLPFNPNPELGSVETVVPVGMRRVVSTERLMVLGKELEVTRTDWNLKAADGFSNLGAQRITYWTADKVKTPAFRFPRDTRTPDQVSKGEFLFADMSPIPTPPGTIRFEYVPRIKDPGDPDGKRAVNVVGVLTSQKEVVLGSKRISVHIFAVDTKSAQGDLQAEYWLSAQVPGFVYLAKGTKKGKRLMKFTTQVTAVENETVSGKLHQVPSGRFAVEIPKGWKIAKSKKREEVFRLERENDEKLHRTITVEISPARDKSIRDWCIAVADASEKTDQPQNVELNSGLGLADQPTFNANPFRESDQRLKTFTIACVYQNQLYVLAHWQDSYDGFARVGETELEAMASSWRFLRPKNK